MPCPLPIVGPKWDVFDKKAVAQYSQWFKTLPDNGLYHFAGRFQCGVWDEVNFSPDGFTSYRGKTIWAHSPEWALAVAFALLPSLVLSKRALKFAQRRRRVGCCINCGYNLTGNVSGVCPECGKPIPKASG